MSTSPATRPLLTGLIDYAGLFPPARLPMAAALAEYEQAHDGRDTWLLGRFLCPAARLDELRSIDGGTQIDVGVIVDTVPSGGDELAIHDAVADALDYRPAMVEIAAGPGAPLTQRVETVIAATSQLAPELPVFVELPRSDGTAPWARALETIAVARRAGLQVGAKIRCGGADAAAYPTTAELATFVVGCRDAGVPFKATAGLHHPVRHTDPTSGFDQHGFLNLLLASALALRDGLDVDAAAAVLDERDPQRLTALLDTIDAETAEHTRRAMLVSYGSCSFTEPTDDLRALGVLPEA